MGKSTHCGYTYRFENGYEHWSPKRLSDKQLAKLCQQQTYQATYPCDQMGTAATNSTVCNQAGASTTNAATNAVTFPGPKFKIPTQEELEAVAICGTDKTFATDPDNNYYKIGDEWVLQGKNSTNASILKTDQWGQLYWCNLNEEWTKKLNESEAKKQSTVLLTPKEAAPPAPQIADVAPPENKNWAKEVELKTSQKAFADMNLGSSFNEKDFVKVEILNGENEHPIIVEQENGQHRFYILIQESGENKYKAITADNGYNQKLIDALKDKYKDDAKPLPNKNDETTEVTIPKQADFDKMIYSQSVAKIMFAGKGIESLDETVEILAYSDTTPRENSAHPISVTTNTDGIKNFSKFVGDKWIQITDADSLTQLNNKYSELKKLPNFEPIDEEPVPDPRPKNSIAESNAEIDTMYSIVDNKENAEIRSALKKIWRDIPLAQKVNTEEAIQTIIKLTKELQTSHITKSQEDALMSAFNKLPTVPDKDSLGTALNDERQKKNSELEEFCKNETQHIKHAHIRNRLEGLLFEALYSESSQKQDAIYKILNIVNKTQDQAERLTAEEEHDLNKQLAELNDKTLRIAIENYLEPATTTPNRVDSKTRTAFATEKNFIDDSNTILVEAIEGITIPPRKTSTRETTVNLSKKFSTITEEFVKRDLPDGEGTILVKEKERKNGFYVQAEGTLYFTGKKMVGDKVQFVQEKLSDTSRFGGFFGSTWTWIPLTELEKWTPSPGKKGLLEIDPMGTQARNYFTDEKGDLYKSFYVNRTPIFVKYDQNNNLSAEDQKKVKGMISEAVLEILKSNESLRGSAYRFKGALEEYCKNATVQNREALDAAREALDPNNYGDTWTISSLIAILESGLDKTK